MSDEIRKEATSVPLPEFEIEGCPKCDERRRRREMTRVDVPRPKLRVVHTSAVGPSQKDPPFLWLIALVFVTIFAALLCKGVAEDNSIPYEPPEQEEYELHEFLWDEFVSPLP